MISLWIWMGRPMAEIGRNAIGGAGPGAPWGVQRSRRPFVGQYLPPLKRFVEGMTGAIPPQQRGAAAALSAEIMDNAGNWAQSRPGSADNPASEFLLDRLFQLDTARRIDYCHKNIVIFT